MKRLLRSYIFWTYQRGSVHYDVMVTLILIFIFFSPRVINFHDHPVERKMSPTQVVVTTDGRSGLVYDVDAATLNPVQSEHDLKLQLRSVIVPISGYVSIDRYAPVMVNGKIISYRVWAHR